jgi:hypothetical protein
VDGRLGCPQSQFEHEDEEKDLYSAGNPVAVFSYFAD